MWRHGYFGQNCPTLKHWSPRKIDPWSDRLRQLLFQSYLPEKKLLWVFITTLSVEMLSDCQKLDCWPGSKSRKKAQIQLQCRSVLKFGFSESLTTREHVEGKPGLWDHYFQFSITPKATQKKNVVWDRKSQNGKNSFFFSQKIDLVYVITHKLSHTQSCDQGYKNCKLQSEIEDRCKHL